MPLLKHDVYTIEDIYSLPDGKRAELIEGAIYNMAPPSRRHQELVSFFTKVIGNYIDQKNGNCKVYPAPFAVFLKSEAMDNDYTNYVEPDISVICDFNKLNERGCKGAPDWIVEIVSPSSRKLDYYLKFALYQMNEVREYWIVDLERQVIIVYNFATMAPASIYRFTDKIKVGIYDDLVIDFSEINF